MLAHLRAQPLEQRLHARVCTTHLLALVLHACALFLVALQHRSQLRHLCAGRGLRLDLPTKLRTARHLSCVLLLEL